MILNANHPVLKRIIADAHAALDKTLAPIDTELSAVNERIKTLRDKKDATDDDKAQLKNEESQAEQLRDKQNRAIADYAATVPQIGQLIDIALLGNNLLRGEQLDNFLKRSIDLLK